MSDTTLPQEVSTLLALVRRRLWAREFAHAARLAAWWWSAVFAATALLHAWRGWPGLAPAMGAGLLVALMLGLFAVARRPDVTRAAAFADRHLDGATAYATVLEPARDTHDATAREARERLLQWAGRRAARSRELLQQSPGRRTDWPARPFGVAMLATALAVVLVVTRTTTSPDPTPPNAAKSTTAVDSMPAGDRSLLDVLEQQPGATGRTAVGESPAAGDAPPRDAGVADPSAASPEPAPMGKVATTAAGAAPPTNANVAAGSILDDASTPASSITDSGGRPVAAGRAAGTTRDPRRPGAETDTSAAARVQWQAAAKGGEAGPPGAHGAHEQVTTYLASGHAWQAPSTAMRVPAADPPSAARDSLPPPGDAAYVDAWRRRLEDSR